MEGGGWCRAMGQIHLDVVPEVQRRCTIVIGRVGMVYICLGVWKYSTIGKRGTRKALGAEGGLFWTPLIVDVRILNDNPQKGVRLLILQ